MQTMPLQRGLVFQVKFHCRCSLSVLQLPHTVLKFVGMSVAARHTSLKVPHTLAALQRG